MSNILINSIGLHRWSNVNTHTHTHTHTHNVNRALYQDIGVKLLFVHLMLLLVHFLKVQKERWELLLSGGRLSSVLWGF